MRVLFYLTILVLLAGSAVGCDSSEEGSDAGKKMTIVATTGMIADAARNIAGDRMEVIGLMGPGVDPHLYRPAQSDLTHLSEADLVLYNGLHLEGKMGDVLERLAGRKPVRAVAERIDPSLLRTPPEFAGSHDPHIWFDVKLWEKAIQEAADAIVAVDTANAEFYRANARNYIARLDSLDAWVREQIASVPQQSRVLITAHDAFGYFGRAYNLEVHGLQGISTVSEFGLADLQNIIGIIADRKIKAVFIESSVPQRNIEALVEGVRGRGHDIKIGGELYSDAMGEEGKPEGTYIGMVSSNVRTIVEALR